MRTVSGFSLSCLQHAWDEIAENSVPPSDAALDFPASIPAHTLLAPLGISALPIEPCRFDCPSAIEAAEQWLELAAARGYAAESGLAARVFLVAYFLV
jgi:hypothetical protein